MHYDFSDVAMRRRIKRATEIKCIASTASKGHLLRTPLTLCRHALCQSVSQKVRKSEERNSNECNLFHIRTVKHKKTPVQELRDVKKEGKPNEL